LGTCEGIRDEKTLFEWASKIDSFIKSAKGRLKKKVASEGKEKERNGGEKPSVAKKAVKLGKN